MPSYGHEKAVDMGLSKGAIVGIGAAVGALLFMGKAHAKPTAENVQELIAAAIASGDPKRMRALASQLMSEGYTIQAAQLETTAAQYEGNRGSSVKDAALAMVANLRGSAKYKENRALVSAYQKAAGSLKVDGLYGPVTALSLADRLSIVPPCPIYWKKETAKQDKDKYTARMLEYAAHDTARFQAWKDAAACMR